MRQLLVGRAQLLLLGLQLLGLRLGHPQQFTGLLGCLDGAERHTGAQGDALQQLGVLVGEQPQPGQFQHAEHLCLELDGDQDQ